MNRARLTRSSAKKRQPATNNKSTREADKDYGDETSGRGGESDVNATNDSDQHREPEITIERDIVIDQAPSIYDAASRLLTTIAPPNATPAQISHLLKGIRNPGTREHKLAAQRQRALKLQLEIFDIDKKALVDAKEVIDSLCSPAPAPSPKSPAWNLKEILQMANLANIAQWLAVAEKDASTTMEYIDALDQVFPEPFLSILSAQPSRSEAFPFGMSQLVDESIGLAIELRTQKAILKIAATVDEDSQDVDAIIRDTFFITSSITGTPSARGWAIADLGGQGSHVNEKIQQLITERIGELECALIDGVYDLETLNDTFEWTSFVHTALDWANRRSVELRQIVKARGGVENMVEEAREAIESDDGTKQDGNDVVAESRTSPTLVQDSAPRGEETQARHTSDMQSAIAFFNQRPELVPLRASTNSHVPRSSGQPQLIVSQSAKPQKSSGTVNTEVTIDPTPQKKSAKDVDQRRRSDVEEDADFTVTQDGYTEQPTYHPESEMPSEEESNHELKFEAPDLESRFSQIKARDKVNKENRGPSKASPARRLNFIDAQARAERVSWESQDVARQPSVASRTHVPAKRPAFIQPDEVGEEEDESMDDEDDLAFGTDERSTDVAARRKAIPQPTRRSLPREASAEAPMKRLRIDPSVHHDSPFASASRIPSSSAPPSSDYRTVNEAARQVFAALREVKVQHREKWTEDEENALIDYIERFGCGWAQIKREDGGGLDAEGRGGPGHLARRDQVALKDKARNMRFDYEKLGMQLPENFECVSLAKSQRERLAKLRR